MNIPKREEYSRSLPNSRWLRNMLEYEKEICDGEELKTLTEILEQSVRVVEGKPIYLTEEQWDWLYDCILWRTEDIMSGPNYIFNTNEEKAKAEGRVLTEEEEYEGLGEWLKSLKEYKSLFEKDIDSM